MKVAVSVEDEPEIMMSGDLINNGSGMSIKGLLVTDFQLNIEKTSISELFFRDAFSGQIKKLTLDGESFHNFEFIAIDDEKFVLLQRRYQKI